MKIDMLRHWSDKRLFNIPTLCAKIVDGMNKNGKILLHTHEPQHPKYNGLYDVLDQLCNYYNWNKSAITIATPNPAVQHHQYNIMRVQMISFDTLSPFVSVHPWNGEAEYGMFIAKATSARIGAIVNHRNFEFKNKGITSFHAVVKNDPTELADYLLESDQKKSEVENIEPYSDIGEVQVPPIWQTQQNMSTSWWSDIYKKIGIEIVCETSTQPECFGITEKTLRPMLFKRPFMIIGSKGYVEFLKDIGIKTFEPIIPDTYDQLEGQCRVDRVFQILHKLIINDEIKTLHSQFNDVFVHNQRRIFELKKEYGTTVEEYYRYIESIPGY